MRDEILEKFGDHGADSSRRDRFQEHYAAYLCIKMLNDPSISKVICEYGEDVVIEKNGTFRLYQVKTKQESVNDWQLKDLIPIFSKTFAMAPYFGNVSKCCFVSNEGATGMLFQLKTILQQPQIQWNDSETKFFEDFCKNHSRTIIGEIKNVDPSSKITIDDIRNFLLKLEIDTDFHHMNYLEDSNVRSLRKYVESAHEQNPFVLLDSELEEAYDRLLGVIGKATIGRSKEEKTIFRNQVLDCLKYPRLRKLLYSFPTAEEIEQAPGQTRLEKKLGLGGFTPLFINNAREEMVSVMNQTRRWDFGHAAEILEDIRFRVRHLCIDHYDKVCKTHPGQEELGREILEEIKKDLPRLIDYYCRTDLPFIDEIFLEGIAMQLTSECKFYWSQHLR